MHLLTAFFCFLAAPFWDAKPAGQWTNEEVQSMFSRSPWVSVAYPIGATGSRVPIPVYLASARPMREADQEVEKRTKRASDPLVEEFRQWEKENGDKYLVLAILQPRTLVTLDSKERKRMESDCVLRVGRKTYKMVMHFPASSSDARLRLIFPRAVQPTDKNFLFELYLPLVSGPYREVEYSVKELYSNAKLEY
ncbi:MAG TPA: hypothetical protein VMZ52_14085 [Bryobacteraceae bacterium]|nr:hypothetical protein [Bryobacteraceae bacterium]